MKFKERLRRLSGLLRPNDLDAFIVWDGYNLMYFSGVPGPGVLIVSEDGQATLYVPPINYEAAERYVSPGIDIERTRINESLEVVAAQAVSGVTGTVGIDRIDAEPLRRLASMVPTADIIPRSEIVWEMRMVKDPSEVSLLREACRAADKALAAASEVLSPGITENEIKAEAVSEIYKQMGDRPAFDVIVASGDGSSLPHGPLARGGTRGRALEREDVVVIDIGVAVEGYCSDITRTFILSGSPSNEFTSAYDLVLRAKKTAESFMKPGASCDYIDSIARRVLSERGLEGYFIHGLGHGLGLEIHEPPRIGPGSPHQLAENMTITCEPGVYIEGRWGIRIEDTLLITANGPEPLTNFPREEYIV